MNTKLLSVVVAVASTLFVALSARAEFTCELEFPSAPSTALANFPVLVRLADDAPTGFSYTDCPTGDCIWFTDAGGTDIPFEVDTWDTAGESLVWVSVPSLSSATTITMHWDAAGAPDGLPAASEVWTRAGYNAVWHFSGSNAESVTNLAPSATRGTPTYDGNVSYPGPVGKTLWLNGSSDLRYAPDPAWTTLGDGPALSVSFFVRSSSGGFARMISCMSDWSKPAGYEFTFQSSNTKITVGSSNKSQMQTDITTGPNTKWKHFAGTWSATTVKFYDDGDKKNEATLNAVVTPTEALTFGSQGGSNTGAPLTGGLDEIRIRRVTSSDDWVAAEYATMATANYVSFGDVEEASAGVAVIRLGVPETVEAVGTTAMLAGRLSKLGDGATAADIYLAYTDGGATTNMVSVGTVSTEPAYFTNTVSGLSYSTQYTYWFTATNNAVPAAFTNSIAATFRTEARDRMLRYTGDMIREYGKRDVGTAEAVATRLQDGIPSLTGTGSDVASYISLDFGATYRITKIVYAGRPVNNTNTRLRGCQFKSSTDDETYTTFYTVPNDYTQDVSAPFLTTNDFYISGNAPSGRFFYVGPINTGSWEECQFWTDSRAIIVSAPSFTGESTSGATATTAVTLDGDFSANATATLTAYVAASDLGSNLADWQSGATPVNCGALASGGTWTGTIPAVASGAVNYVRFLAAAETVEGTTVSEFSAVASSFTAVSFVENRPLVESSASMLSLYPGTIAQAYKAFDNDETTAGGNNTAAYGALDYGRAVRIDRVRIVSIGVNSIGIPIQASQDGWTWQTVTNRVAGDGLAVNIDLLAPVVARYIRFGGDGTWQPTPQINEIRTYAREGEAFVAVTNLAATHTTQGLVVSGTVAASGLAAGTKVSIYGYVGPQDYGMRKADWDAAGVTPTLIGQYSAGVTFTTPPMNGTANATSGVRYGAVVAVASGAASSMGTAHPFTLNDEELLDITQEMVVTNYANMANLANTWRQGFWGNRTAVNLGDNCSNGAATFGGKQYRITMIEWHDRLEGGCLDRARAAKFRIYNSAEIIGSTDYSDIASASSAWGASAANTFTVHANRWNAVAPAEKAVGYGVGVDYADHGNGFFRFWGYKDTARGLSIFVR